MTSSSGTLEVLTPKSFQRLAKRFLRQRRDLELPFRRLLTELEADPYQPALRLHALKGALDGFHAVSLTYSHRVVLILKVDERSITLVDIGDHDDVHR